MAWTQSEIDALKSAYASGVLEVRYDGVSTRYDDGAALLARIRVIEAEIAATSGNPRPRVGFASFRRS
ncbi:phage head-tail joining protein [Rubellimicrobium aerolatum]|uniref:Phage head-tail joining protein n=1 Tax=Rubellimicrobium aerolatum TaxID=490979 RepID=A0ABW0SF43_9RHOB|nr:hypothetical protein [Rubellimicrobium aerolatum]MBP1806469.1 hypothetical protein [Rubellimicrobium aerolatum]